MAYLMLHLAQEFILDFLVHTNRTDRNQNSFCRTALRYFVAAHPV